jgi:hypothetical protein
MTFTHYRKLGRIAFFDGLGLEDWALRRLPHSPVVTADVILRDREGRELGRFELRYDEDGDAAPWTQMVPCATPRQLEERATLWL